ncbi:thiamine biosynthesis protein ThiS [Halothiobacillus diazotrophicus]|uniref:Thiamine biosynthesis protein ThiS n=1 Tax=Halothiobacillus diazotrophicus TaxID=1860122 RepID=A0A191ZIE8_9GAMM|nr:sulfur carrier protein ThiS [Halothiobacillus diazotrophicus]ANJ67644.1 thiamine biosynthesis protein ThiS [Halothiobacillus diazotrophicus]
MTVFINGEVREISDGLNVQDLLRLLEMLDMRLAVELNGEILPRRLFGETKLAANDRVEIVHAIGGG